MTDGVPYNVLVADDELHGRMFVCALIEQDPRFKVIEICDCGRTASHKARSTHCDVMFLDVQMPGMDGFEVVDTVQGIKPLIVFVTAHGEFALRAFEYAAFDYIKKPINPTRFTAVLDRLCSRLDEGRAAGSSSETVVSLQHNVVDELKSDQESKKVLSAVRQDVLYRDHELELIESAGNYVNVRVNGEMYLVRTSLENFCRELDPNIFVRVHRSFVVNILSVRRMQYGKSGAADLFLADGHLVPVSRGRRREVADILRRVGNNSVIHGDDTMF